MTERVQNAMDSSHSSHDRSQTLRNIFARLREPIAELEELEDLLRTFLNAFDLGRSTSSSTLITELPKAPHQPPRTVSSQHARMATSIQDLILFSVVPTWDRPLKDDHKEHILQDVFCPIPPSGSSPSSSPAAGELALSAYSVLISSTITPFTLRVLPRLLERYPIDAMHTLLFGSGNQTRLLDWEMLLKAIGSIPARVANAMGEDSSGIPEALQYRYVQSVQAIPVPSFTMKPPGTTPYTFATASSD